MNSLDNSLRNLNICIVKHTLTPRGGVEEELLKFLKNKVKNILYISHPFKEAELQSLRSEALIYRRGILKKQFRSPLIKGPAILFYIKDVFYTVGLVLWSGMKFDVFVGVDCLNAFAGYILKKIGKVKKLVFYVIDYSPKRFENKLMNKIYHLIDRLVCYKADIIWNLSGAMTDARINHGINIKRCAPSIVVPHGNAYNRIKRQGANEVKRHQLVYFGRLEKEHGADKLIDLFCMIRKEIPDSTLLVIGSGNLRTFLINSAKAAGLGEYVKFTGFIEGENELYDIISKSGIGVAPYPDNNYGYKFYSDPGKIKTYMACGLPIVMTRVPRIYIEIESNKAGFAVGCNLNQMKEAILNLMTNNELYIKCKENSEKLASKYDWNNIFANALSDTLKNE